MNKLINWVLLVMVVVVGTGVPPATAHSDAQGRVLARRAAIVDCYAQYHAMGIHKGFIIVGEAYSNGVYTVTMDAN